MKIQYCRVETPIGPAMAFTNDDSLVALDFEDRRADVELALRRRYGSLQLVPGGGAAAIASRLEQYFAGDITALDSIEVDAAGTPFQLKVWQALRRIPAGTTTTYADIARSIGHPRAYRAVGSANANNPIAIVVPCHRVIGADRRLHGYAGGLERKQWLLEHEVKSAVV